MSNLLKRSILILALTSTLTAQAVTSRVRDLAFFLGAQNNQLFGIGIVAGLNNDGDKNLVPTLASMANVLQTFGITLPASALSSKNIALVMVTANLPDGAKPGNTIDVTVAAMGDAKSLQGGVLQNTLLFGLDKDVYATAQGAVTIGGFSLGTGGAGGASVQKNHPTTGQVINGGNVQKTVPVTLVRNESVDIILNEKDYTTAARMAEAINAKYSGSSQAMDASTVRVKIPDTYQTVPVDFVAQLQAIELTPDTPARIILNERTGTIVVTGRVKISSCAVSHGNIVVKIAESLDVSQPSPFAQVGTTQVTPRTDLQVTEEKARLKAFPEMPTIDKIANSLNEMGATPRDMMAIFQAMKQAGALHAELRTE
jgi:flagellar P-ring protein precursor FlgI